MPIETELNELRESSLIQDSFLKKKGLGERRKEKDMVRRKKKDNKEVFFIIYISSSFEAFCLGSMKLSLTSGKFVHKILSMLFESTKLPEILKSKLLRNAICN